MHTNTFASLAAGNTIAFCRGGSFGTVSGYWFNGNARAANPVFIRDYTPSCAGPSWFNVWGSARPASRYQWTVEPVEPRKTVRPHQEGIVLMNITGTESFVYNDTDDVRICNMQFLGGANGVNLVTCNGGTAGDASCTNDRVKLVGNRFIDNDMGVGMYGNLTGGEIRDNYFYGCGGSTFNHSIYLGGDRSLMGTALQTAQVHQRQRDPPAGREHRDRARGPRQPLRDPDREQPDHL